MERLRKELHECQVHCSGGDTPCPTCASAVAIEQKLVSSLTNQWGRFIQEAISNHTQKVKELTEKYGEKNVPKRPEVGEALNALQQISLTKFESLSAASEAYQAQLSDLLLKYNMALESRAHGAELIAKLNKQLKYASDEWKRCEDYVQKYVSPSD